MLIATCEPLKLLPSKCQTPHFHTPLWVTFGITGSAYYNPRRLQMVKSRYRRPHESRLEGCVFCAIEILILTYLQLQPQYRHALRGEKVSLIRYKTGQSYASHFACDQLVTIHRLQVDYGECTRPLRRCGVEANSTYGKAVQCGAVRSRDTVDGLNNLECSTKR